MRAPPAEELTPGPAGGTTRTPPEDRMRAPHANSYLVPGHALIAGEYPFSTDVVLGREKLAAILDVGVTCFLDLTEADELVPYAPELEHAGERVRHVRLPVRDLHTPMRSEMVRILDTIDDGLAAGDRVYLHCWGGVGRTGTVVGCFLVRHGMTGEQALAEVQRLFQTMSPTKLSWHARSPETERQCHFVRTWFEDDGPPVRAEPSPT